MMFKCKLILFDNNFFVSFKGHIFDALTLMSLTPSQLLEFSTCFFFSSNLFSELQTFLLHFDVRHKMNVRYRQTSFPPQKKNTFFLIFFNLFREVSRLLNVVRSEITFYDEILWSSMTFCRVL